MKMNLTSQQTIASEGLKMTRMGIEESSMDMIIGYLRDKIYSDKILAPIREYVCNAMDAMVEAGNTTDTVEISLKSINSSWVWSVRDYGDGLNDKDITDVFGCYGASRKRHTNNQVGTYGVGSGSAFAYTDSFYVTSHHKGVKTSYVCTLGKGDNGVAVGEIYKISEEPTTERGIEISLEVKNSDIHSFSPKTQKFVEFYNPNGKIKFIDSYYNEEHVPISPIKTTTIGEYTFSTYEKEPFYQSGNRYYVRMGGACYPYTTTKGNSRVFSNPVIVDVPIGKLTVPISRESIENTPLNDKVHAEIEKLLDVIQADDIKDLATPKFGDVITGHSSMNTTYNTEWFQYDYNEIFPKTKKWYYKSGKIYSDPSGGRNGLVVSKGPIYTVYIMPDISNIKNWHKRLIRHLTDTQGDDYKGYVYMQSKSYKEMLLDLDDTIDLSDCVFVDVKTLKLPPLEKNSKTQTPFQVFNSYGSKSSYTSVELDQQSTNRFFNGCKPKDDWHLEVKNRDVLNSRTIGLVSQYGTRANFYTVNSIKMVDAMKELGWITPDSSEYINASNRIREINDRIRIINNAEHQLSQIYFGAHTDGLVFNHIRKNPNKIVKLAKVKERIIEESTTRGRILQSINSYNYKINRQDLRKILLLKD